MCFIIQASIKIIPQVTFRKVEREFCNHCAYFIFNWNQTWLTNIRFVFAFDLISIMS